MTTARFADDLLRPEHDSEQTSGARATHSYVICSTPRSGSGLLSRGLASTGELGVPLEYLNRLTRDPLAERWRCGLDLDAYLAALHAHRVSSDGLFGAKVHWDQVPRLRSESGVGSAEDHDFHTDAGLMERAFPAARYVRIVREDLDSQAVSYWRALRSKLWSVAAHEQPASHETPYSFDGIDDCRRALENGELCWQRLIRELRAEELVVTYEQLTDAYAQTIVRVAEFVRPGVELVPAPPAIRMMRDGRSRELLQRYRADRSRRAVASTTDHEDALERAAAENARLRQAVLAQERTLAFLHQRHDTLCRVERGGWWRLRGRLSPLLRVASRMREAVSR